MSCLWQRSVWLVGIGLVGSLVGCQRTSSTPSPPRGPGTTEVVVAKEFDAESGPFAAGKKVMVANGCFRCHAVDGARPAGAPPAGKFGRGPDLGKTGKDAEHTVEWFTKFVRNPKSIREEANMPSFDERKINNDAMKSLADYLASLK